MKNIEKEGNRRNFKKLYKAITSQNDKPEIRINRIKYKLGKVTENPNKMKEVWKEYFEYILTRHRNEEEYTGTDISE